MDDYEMTYEEQLQDPRWLLLRQEIIDRDWGMCQRCMSSKDLHVHHRQYIEGRLAWQYPHFYLETLCSKCHSKEHKGKSIITFVKPPDVIMEAGERIRQSMWALAELAKRQTEKHG